MSIVVRDNKKLRAANKRLRAKLDEMEDLIDALRHEKQYTEQLLDEERAAKEKAQAEKTIADAHIRTERAKSAAMKDSLVRAQRESKHHMRLKAAHKRAIINFTDPFFADIHD